MEDVIKLTGLPYPIEFNNWALRDLHFMGEGFKEAAEEMLNMFQTDALTAFETLVIAGCKGYYFANTKRSERLANWEPDEEKINSYIAKASPKDSALVFNTFAAFAFPKGPEQLNELAEKQQGQISESGEPQKKTLGNQKKKQH